jgi:hypothetical protein
MSVDELDDLDPERAPEAVDKAVEADMKDEASI